ncbi:PACE efflux transporter [Amorphus orientalis]|uniref:Membrane protein n=1 Tax=Amorphus orientalis TaxID=649198 RepID=A0AAE3VQA5_9HYPH|nr:PACE efflux transporter [Amorphus orientalis]MDQ0315865.1 putative membrane protein [Amorphus orientalis]
MRSVADRIRHTLSFEIIGLALVTPLGTLVIDKPLVDIGAVALGSSVVATAWNYIYNLGFDTALLRLRGDPRKTVPLRVVHALLFEAGLLLILLPLIAWYLGISLWQALVMDLFFVAFYIVYAFIFNWLYDLVFPIPMEPTSRSG